MTTKTKIKVVMLAAEAAPLIKVGGLGDVTGSLPIALESLGAEVTLFLPLYGSIDRKKYKLKKIKTNLHAHLCREIHEKFSLWQTTLPGSRVKVYCIEHDFFNHKKVYNTPRHYDRAKKHYSRGVADIERFGFFSKACLMALRELELKPDILHCHDWHTAITPDLLVMEKTHDDFFAKTKTVYTIHNLANQGITDKHIAHFLCLPQKNYRAAKINFMKRGIQMADALNTVSPTYAKEILTAEYGAKLQAELRKRRRSLRGILNGLDIKKFNPQTDKRLWSRYTLKNLKNKTKNKVALQKSLGLEVGDRPLFGLISRLVYQKGIDLIVPNVKKLISDGAQFVFLGTGDKKIEQALKKLAKKYPLSVSSNIMFDVTLANRIYAGADFFLMPSRFEPCGLGQMIAMRYGTPPIARETGGLKDTVKPNVGFPFKAYTPQAMKKSMKKAINLYHQPTKFAMMKKTAMQQDFSWQASAKKYLQLYKKLNS